MRDGNCTETFDQSRSRDRGPATDAQAAFLSALHGEGDRQTHVEQLLVTAPTGILDLASLKAAWDRLARRHQILRTVLTMGEGGQPRLCVHDEPAVDVSRIDLTGSLAAEQDRAIGEHLGRDRRDGVDPTQAIGWRVVLFDLGGGQGRMLWTIHHALIDGTSIGIILDELWGMLTGRPPPDDPPQFSELLARRDLDLVAARSAFASVLSDPSVAATFPRAMSNGPAAMRNLAIALPAATGQSLRTACSRAGATPLNAVQAAWAMVLARWTGRPGAAFGLVEAGRTMAGTERATGCFISTVPFQIRLDDQPDIGGLLRRLRDLTLQLRPHAHASQTQIRQWSGRTGADALFDTVVMYQRDTIQARLRQNGCGWTEVRLIEQGQAPMSLSVHDAAEGFGLSLEYDAAQVPEATAHRVLGHLQRLLEEIGRAEPDTALSALPMLTPDEEAQVLALGRPPALGQADPRDIAARFEAIAAAKGRHIGVVEAATGRSLDFAQLDRLANGIAWRLADAGADAGQVVAIALPRSAEQIAAMLAVLKLGAAFTQLDLDQPQDYLRKLMDQAGARILIADPDTALAEERVTVVPAAGVDATDPPMRPVLSADSLAYVTFTSGSTGVPKAVMGRQGALSAHADAVIEAFALTGGDRVLQFASPGFDVMLEEVWPTLLAGATVILGEPGPARPVQDLLAMADRQGVTLLNLPASYWQQMVATLAEQGRGLPGSVRLVVTGSERVSPVAYQQWRRIAGQVALFNAYGPTEATITCTLWKATALAAEAELPIGRPLAHARVLLRASDGTLTPRGGEGELWIGGAAVAGGYLNDPQSTAAMFTPDPWDADGRLYRSGDLARWSPHNQLMFLGRADRQIKLRGHRIDLAHVEGVLASRPGVAQVYVDLDKGPPARLLAWVILRPGATSDTIARQLVGQLPGYMIPRLIQVPDLPLTPNGKIAVAHLPRPAARAGAVQQESQDPLALGIARNMAQVLDLPHVRTDDDFHDLGGDSLLALRLITLVKTHLGVSIHGADVMREPTPEGLARLALSGEDRPRYLIRTQPRGSRVPIIAVHVLGRRQELFRPLSAALGPDFPLWGLTLGPHVVNRPIEVGATAQLYFEELQRHFPDKPVCLIAVSMASYFALELAQLLRGAGREVTVLAVLDAAGPDGRPTVTGAARLRAHLHELRRRGVGHLRSILRHRLGKRQQRPDEELPDGVDDMEQVIQANVRAVSCYVPKPYDRPITIFRADMSFWDTRDSLRRGLGWASVAAAGWTLHDLPGDHLSILAPGNVDTLAEHLRRLVPVAEAADLGEECTA